jgi:hypothetical protein
LSREAEELLLAHDWPETCGACERHQAGFRPRSRRGDPGRGPSPRVATDRHRRAHLRRHPSRGRRPRRRRADSLGSRRVQGPQGGRRRPAGNRAHDSLSLDEAAWTSLTRGSMS